MNGNNDDACKKNFRSDTPSVLGERGFTHRALFVAALVAAISAVPGGWSIALDAMGEAFLAVAVFVAGTLALVSYAERGLKIGLGIWLHQHRRWQAPVATLLGAFSGCGGAIIAVTQYTRGHLSFGAVVAALIATMGDALFLMLAREPRTAFGVTRSDVVANVNRSLGGWVNYFYYRNSTKAMSRIRQHAEDRLRIHPIDGLKILGESGERAFMLPIPNQAR